MKKKHIAVAAFAWLALAACRGGISESPPVHLVLDMDFQPKIKAQSEVAFDGWPDHRGMRLPVKDTVARGSLPDLAAQKLMPDAAHPGKNVDGSYIKQNPLPLTPEVLARGRERIEINCSPCHGLTGRGGNGAAAHGMVGARWPVPIPSFQVQPVPDGMRDDVVNRVAKQDDGVFFETMTNGKTTMPSYGERITPADRWSIVHYIRALQIQGKQQ